MDVSTGSVKLNKFISLNLVIETNKNGVSMFKNFVFETVSNYGLFSSELMPGTDLPTVFQIEVKQRVLAVCYFGDHELSYAEKKAKSGQL